MAEIRNSKKRNVPQRAAAVPAVSIVQSSGARDLTAEQKVMALLEQSNALKTPVTETPLDSESATRGKPAAVSEPVKSASPKKTVRTPQMKVDPVPVSEVKPLVRRGRKTAHSKVSASTGIAADVELAKAEPEAAHSMRAVSEDSAFSFLQIKERIMATQSFTENLTQALSGSQEKAKAAFDKGAAALNDCQDFTKGNIEALVESSKILTTGLQDLSSSCLTEGRSAFETATADFKELGTAKSPADFLKIQSEILRKQFDSVVSTSSKNSEAMLKIMSEAFVPLSGRVNVALDKVRKASV